MKKFFRRHFLAAFVETVILILGTVIAYFFIFKVVHYESPYEGYRKNGSDQIVTVASAIGMVEDGEMVDGADKHGLSKLLIDVYNREISYGTAILISIYVFSGLVAGVICLAAGVGFPFAWRKRGALVDRLDRALESRGLLDREVHYDYWWNDWTYKGETLSGAILWLVYPVLLIIAGVWGILLPVVIAVNVVFAVVVLIMRPIKFAILNIGDRMRKRKGNVCSLSADGSFFRVEQDQKNGLYFRQYWNAVAAKRIMEKDMKGKDFSEHDAENYILYGNEEQHDRYEFNRRWNRVKALFDGDLRGRDMRIREGNYCPVDVQDKGEKGTYLLELVSGGTVMEGTLMSLHCEANYFLMCQILEFDKEKKCFAIGDWNRWKEKQKNSAKAV